MALIQTTGLITMFDIIRKTKIQQTFLLFTLCFSFSIYADDNAEFFKTLLPYAELSNVVYLSNEKMQKVARQYNLSISAIKNIPGHEVTFILLTDTLKRRQIIVVRGTANVENALLPGKIYIRALPMPPPKYLKI